MEKKKRDLSHSDYELTEEALSHVQGGLIGYKQHSAMNFARNANHAESEIAGGANGNIP